MRDVLGSGISIDQLSRRTVAIHGSAFSPNNCQIDRVDVLDEACHAFWLVASDGDKAVISFHCFAASDEGSLMLRSIAEQARKQLIILLLLIHILRKQAPTLGVLVDALANLWPVASEAIEITFGGHLKA